MKCDETRPQFSKCVRSGRHCDGYPVYKRARTVEASIPIAPRPGSNATSSGFVVQRKLLQNDTHISNDISGNSNKLSIGTGMPLDGGFEFTNEQSLAWYREAAMRKLDEWTGRKLSDGESGYSYSQKSGDKNGESTEEESKHYIAGAISKL